MSDRSSWWDATAETEPKERKERARHPSTRIPEDVFNELAMRVYLSRFEPPMTLEKSLHDVQVDDKGKVTSDHAMRLRDSKSVHPVLRRALRFAYDMGLLKIEDVA